MEERLKIDAGTNIQEQRVARAGFNSSGVSRNNRMIERHAFAFGAYWKSYDFAGNTGRQNLFAHPLGPGRGDDTFQHDGGEIIFNLPNGLQAYLLVDGQGKRIDEGPTKIVSVKNRPDPTVINGVSCMSCHVRGVIDKADQVRAHVEKNPGAFSELDAKAIRSLYPPQAELRTLLRQDAERFRKAVEATGSKVAATEPIVALAARFESELDLSTAAAEANLPADTLLAGLETSSPLAQRLGALRVEGGTVQRAVFVETFDELVRHFHLGRSLRVLDQNIAAATAVIRKQPASAAVYVQRGNAYFDKGEFDRARADYSEAIRRNDRDAVAYRNRGMTYAQQGDSGRAIADYDEALRWAPRHAATYHNRGLAHAQKGEFARAVADLTEALHLDPHNATAYSDRGFVRARQRDDARAIADYDEALRRAPHSPSTLVRRGDVHRRRGDQTRAIADYDAALALYPRLAAAYQGRAMARRQNGDCDGALADALRTLRFDPRNALAIAELARQSLAWLR
ncbi:MAG: tetratricopeptide repeat protein [Gemmataceae bacterium]|nr:tetratricopeptide repeat protein [Gemmataceae bacterium]